MLTECKNSEDTSVKIPIKRYKADVRIGLGHLTQHNIKQLRLVNQSIFPIMYSNKFYTDVLKNMKMCRLAYFNDIVVGAVCYRIDSISATTGTDTGKAAKMEGTSSGQKKLYIMTLGCLAPYRRLGIGSMLLRHVSKFCHKHGHLESIFLHVQVSNTDAVEFYKKFGFSISGEIKGYYRRITPQGAYILEKRLPDSDVHDYSSDSE